MTLLINETEINTQNYILHFMNSRMPSFTETGISIFVLIRIDLANGHCTDPVTYNVRFIDLGRIEYAVKKT